MTAAKHTPGPWKADLCLGGWGMHEVQRPDGTSIARLAAIQTAFAPDDEEGMANAQLMAAAPELLDSLREVLQIAQQCIDSLRLISDERQALADAATAIAKATGGAA